MPYIKAAKELKTKPTQHSVKQLQEVGIQPDVLVLRTEKEIPAEMRRKIALFCNVAPDAVIQSVDVPSIYEVPGEDARAASRRDRDEEDGNGCRGRAPYGSVVSLP